VTLVNSSVWIEVFRGRTPLALTTVVEFDDVVTCLPVVQEVLQGFGDERVFRLAREAMLSMPMVESPLGEGLLLEATTLYRAARKMGRTVRSSVDCLIAACALRHDLEILHRNRDFGALAAVSALRERQV